MKVGSSGRISETWPRPEEAEMHVLLVADGRSPHTLGWIRGLLGIGIRTTLLSSRRLDEVEREAFGELSKRCLVYEPDDLWNRLRPALAKLRPRVDAMRPRQMLSRANGQQPNRMQRIEESADLAAAYRLGTFLRRLLPSVAPDVVHALRIQYEAIAAVSAKIELPLAVSTWGSDLITTAAISPELNTNTRRAVESADFMFSDCERDAELADSFGLRPGVPKLVVPGNFGLDFDNFPEADRGYLYSFGLVARPLVTYPRGIRGCIDPEALVGAFISLVESGVDASFLAVGLNPAVDSARQIPGTFSCTSKLSHDAMLRIAAISSVTVSPSTSDGVPNSVLEGMAGGSIPVCGDLASLREVERKGAVMVWCDPADPRSIADGVKVALRLASDPENPIRNMTVARQHYSTSSAQANVRQAYLGMLR